MKTEEGMRSTRDWRKALGTPPAYRVINRTIRTRTHLLAFLGIMAATIVYILYLFPVMGSPFLISTSSAYNITYPLTQPIKSNSMYTFRIGIIADLDTNSKSKSEKNIWISYFKKGYLNYNPTNNKIFVSWDKNGPVILKNSYASKDRGMELSELVVFNGKLLTFDDRTGLVFEIINDEVIPWILLMDGDGRNKKGFKSEWAAVKNEQLYVGSMGKEWTKPTGEFMNHNPQYIKIINTHGQIQHISWVKEYERIREVLNIYWPGYMIHESGVWSDIHQRWFFLPRRCSKEKYNEVLDEHRGCSVLISADSHLNRIIVVQIPNSAPTRGFSSFKFVPMSQDEIIVALRTEELEGNTSTYITAFTIDGAVLIGDLHIADSKYEGLEFI